jgi:purine-binding chemotaxis protein CheW
MTAARRQRGPVDFAEIRRRLEHAASDAQRLSPEQAHELLERRARALAQKPSDEESARTLEVLCFKLAGERYAIDTRSVLQVQALGDLTRMPDAPEHLLGVTNLRGQVLPVFDLRALLGVARPPLCDMTRLLVLGESEAELGILADVAEEISALDPAQLLSPSQPLHGLERACVRGVTRDALVVLDGAALLCDRRLFLEDLPDERAQA